METQVNVKVISKKSTRFTDLEVGDFFYFDTDDSILCQKVSQEPYMYFIIVCTGELHTYNPQGFDPKVSKVKSVDITVTL